MVIKAKSRRIVQFLVAIHDYYENLMKNEAIYGKHFQKLGFPSIQIGTYTELQLFKDLFDTKRRASGET